MDDTQGGTTKEGIHLGVMAGTLDLVQRAYLGIEIRDDVVYFNPTLADRLDGLRMSIQVRRTPIVVSLDGSEITVAVPADGDTAPIRVGVGKAVRELCGGQSATFKVGERASDSGMAWRVQRSALLDDGVHDPLRNLDDGLTDPF
jgi:trehalose/maltose hydrolase-like predicted phosphorylase